MGVGMFGRGTRTSTRTTRASSRSSRSDRTARAGVGGAGRCRRDGAEFRLARREPPFYAQRFSIHALTSPPGEAGGSDTHGGCIYAAIINDASWYLTGPPFLLLLLFQPSFISMLVPPAEEYPPSRATVLPYTGQDYMRRQQGALLLRGNRDPSAPISTLVFGTTPVFPALRRISVSGGGRGRRGVKRWIWEEDYIPLAFSFYYASLAVGPLAVFLFLGNRFCFFLGGLSDTR